MEKEEKETNQLLEKRYGAKLEEYKKQYAPRKLSVIVVEDKTAILRPVTAAEMGQYSLMIAGENGGLDTACRYLLESLWLDGDNCIRDDEEYFISAMLTPKRYRAKKKQLFENLERGENSNDGYAAALVFGLEKLGYQLLCDNENLFFYLTGVALKLAKQKN